MPQDTISTAARGLLAAALLGLAACGGIDLHDNPGHDVSKQEGPLTVPPPHLKEGVSQ